MRQAKKVTPHRTGELGGLAVAQTASNYRVPHMQGSGCADVLPVL